MVNLVHSIFFFALLVPLFNSFAKIPMAHNPNVNPCQICTICAILMIWLGTQSELGVHVYCITFIKSASSFSPKTHWNSNAWNFIVLRCATHCCSLQTHSFLLVCCHLLCFFWFKYNNLPNSPKKRCAYQEAAIRWKSLSADGLDLFTLRLKIHENEPYDQLS